MMLLSGNKKKKEEKKEEKLFDIYLYPGITNPSHEPTNILQHTVVA